MKSKSMIFARIAIFLAMIAFVLIIKTDVFVRRPLQNYNITKAKSKEALAYCTSKGYNSNICILVDMSIHSGLNRMFLWNFKKDTIAYACLVSHGCGSMRWSSDATRDNPVFSNRHGSHTTSLGKYKIGGRGRSAWGINVNYALYGLEPTNANAAGRQVVFHSWSAISSTEVYPVGTPEGWGCPAVSNSSMRYFDDIIRHSGKPVLMWIYN